MYYECYYLRLEGEVTATAADKVFAKRLSLFFRIFENTEVLNAMQRKTPINIGVNVGPARQNKLFVFWIPPSSKPQIALDITAKPVAMNKQKYRSSFNFSPDSIFQNHAKNFSFAGAL